ncbi:MAG: hypothetical protein ABI831_20150 [Betaproteobacteria bacterium]
MLTAFAHGLDVIEFLAQERQPVALGAVAAAVGNAALCVSSPCYRIDAAWNRKVPKAVMQAAREISGIPYARSQPPAQLAA